MLITEAYRELNRQLHETNEHYGTSGQKYAGWVRQLCKQLGTQNVLDYGCGKRTLERELGFAITNYDPCLPGLDAAPKPHDVVACTDVAEHVEPDCVEAFLADLRRVTGKVLFMTIATGPAKKFLADGRNAHLIQKGQDWWLPRIWQAGFGMEWLNDMGVELVLVLR